MAQTSKIDHIEYGGVVYEFEDSTARTLAIEYAKKVEAHDAEFEGLVNKERDRAESEEARIEAKIVNKVDGIPGKGLSTNDFTDEYKNMIGHPAEMEGATETTEGRPGVVPTPLKTDVDHFLKGDGTWGTPIDTTYEPATRNADGLMSAADKLKLDTMDAENDDLISARTVFEENTITERLTNGKTKVTTFNADGSITLRITKAGTDPITINTVFNEDGSITRTRT